METIVIHNEEFKYMLLYTANCECEFLDIISHFYLFLKYTITIYMYVNIVSYNFIVGEYV